MKTRKELKAEYKERKAPMGVLQIRNTVNGKVFLDASLDLPALWNRHRFQLDFGNHPSTELQTDWKRFGALAFVYDIVAEINREETESPQDYRADVAALLELCLEERKPWGEAGYHNIPTQGRRGG